jgi:hypothetical protein
MEQCITFQVQEKICPLDNIKMADGTPMWQQDVCFHLKDLKYLVLWAKI